MLLIHVSKDYTIIPNNPIFTVQGTCPHIQTKEDLNRNKKSCAWNKSLSRARKCKRE